MFISSIVKDEIPFPSENGFQPLKCQENVDEFSPTKSLSNSSPFPTNCTDVDLAPEQKRSEVERLISSLEEEIAGLRLKLRYFDQKRREVLNKLLDFKGSIRVYCRIRPFWWTDRKAIHEPISAGPEKILVRSVGIRKEFEFDKVFTQSAAQEDVFVEVEPILRSALDGHNVCILAFGQTGTGKTFTMEGTNEQPGIVPRALKELFRQANLDSSTAPTFSMSMLEVYMGSLKDLLARKPSHRAYELVSSNLNIQMDPKGAVEIEGLSNMPISDLNKAIWWYNRGRRARSTSCTNVNDMSSRSHCLTRIAIVQHGDEAKVSKLWLVDLGGSERLLKTGARGQTLDEGRAINLSLSALGNVIASLIRRRNHIPYRNSKLTQILRDSLGDGSKVLMLVHVSPCKEDVAETICSLSFAKRARAVESSQVLSEDMKTQREKRMVELADEMRNTEEEYLKVQNQIKKAEFLLSENQKLLSSINFQHSKHEASNNDNDNNNPGGGKEDSLEETPKSPQIPEKAVRRYSIPRFMTSTVASRQRQSSSEKEIYTRAMRSLRSVTTTRSSIQLSCSQSISHMADPRLKSLRGNTNTRKPRELPRKDNGNGHNAVCINAELRSSSTPSEMTTVAVASNSNSAGTRVGWHRRRMSSLI